MTFAERLAALKPAAMRIAAVSQWLFVAFIGLIGLDLATRGAQLAMLGGSWYYVLSGVALIGIAVLHALRSVWAVRVFAAVTALTLVWALSESALDLLGLLPRVGAYIVVGLWFAMPWTRRHLGIASGLRKERWSEMASAAAVLMLVVSGVQGYSVEQGSQFGVAQGPVSTDWRAYGNQDGGQRFAQVDQINTKNVGQLKEVWRYRTGVAFDFKDTPLEVNGLVYVCTAGNVVVALDADTGEERWKHDPQVKVPGGSLENASTFARTCRGLSYHEQAGAGACSKRILGGTVDGRLIAIDAMTGSACKDFGDGGSVDLNAGLGRHVAGNYMITSPPLVAGDLVVAGGWVSDNQKLGNVSGVLRAYDARTGKFAWAWDMGRPDEHGQPGEGDEYTRGTPNVWSIMSYDAKLNLIYAPTGNAGPDYFDGGLRSEASETYASSVVAIDAGTGAPRWSFQTVHRDIWDYDVPSQPVLVDIRKDGQLVSAVVIPTKRGEVFVLDRATGKPVWPVEERPVPQGPEEGERVSATQPFSTLPNFRPDRHESDMWGMTPLDELSCRIQFKKLRYEGHFTPPMRDGDKYDGTFVFPGDYGGFNWGSVSVDADNGLLVAAPMMVGTKVVLRNAEDRAKAGPSKNDHGDPSGGEALPADPRFDQSRVKYTAEVMPFMSEWTIPGTHVSTQLPCTRPPYGMIAVMDLNTGKMLWKRPLGTMKKSGPFGKASGLPVTVGTPLQGGSITTRGGLIFHAGAMDSTIRAIDLRSGKERWHADLPGNAQATPMTYLSPQTGKQYVVITVPNPSWKFPWPDTAPTDDKGGWVIAYALK